MHGLHGYREVIETVQWGLMSLGLETTVGTNSISATATNIVLGSQMLDPAAIDALPPDTIVYNLEQIAGVDVGLLKPSFRAAARRLQVWEYSERNFSAWEQLQPARPVAHVPIGWAPVLARIPRAEPQDIDVLHYGMPNEFRLSVFNELCTRGLSCAYLCGLYGAGRDGLIARSKLVLNLNYYSFARIFEIVRVSYLLANAKAVVSDLHPDSFVEADLREAVALVPPAEIADCCQRLLNDDVARRQLEIRGAESIRRRDIRAILAQALQRTRPTG